MSDHLREAHRSIGAEIARLEQLQILHTQIGALLGDVSTSTSDARQAGRQAGE